jgi:hypothetical protein
VAQLEGANEQFSPIPLLPLRAPPEPLRYPPLPCPPRDPRFASEYTVTTHLIPAAYPRSSPFVSVPAFKLPDHESRDERGARIQLYKDELFSLQDQHGPDHSGTQPQPTVPLWSVLNRYVRKGNGGGLTLVLLHANGLHKEVGVHNPDRGGGFLSIPSTDHSRHLNPHFDIYYKPPMKINNTISMKFGPLTPCNTATLGWSTHRTSELYVGHPSLTIPSD